jgi:hypothetical protein
LALSEAEMAAVLRSRKQLQEDLVDVRHAMLDILDSVRCKCEAEERNSKRPPNRASVKCVQPSPVGPGRART